jgi:hypothetical protein
VTALAPLFPRHVTTFTTSTKDIAGTTVLCERLMKGSKEARAYVAFVVFKPNQPLECASIEKVSNSPQVEL